MYLGAIYNRGLHHVQCLSIIYPNFIIIDICQWAIFCLRNVLENNQGNQQVIRSLTQLGLASNTRLAEAGFVVEETTDGKLRVVGKQNRDTAP